LVDALQVRDERDVSRARQYVLDRCLASGLMSVCDDAALLTSEVVTNAVRHAPPGAITVRAERDGDQFVVQVLDGSLQEPRILPADPWSERGRGMALVNALARDWGVVPHPSGKVVWFRL
jgi:anti-sigma regulatory factor (Ser/Thr protein kinase)